MRVAKFRSRLLLAVGPLVLTSASSAEPLPASASEFLARNCVACHSGDQPQAGVDLSFSDTDWGSREAVAQWERVYEALSSAKMPPAAANQLSAPERGRMVDWLQGRLLAHSGVGGGVPRRLNRAEYENSIRDLFGISDFALPHSFPADDSSHGFDNVGSGLILSPPVMAQYLELATRIADELLPPDTGPHWADAKTYKLSSTAFDSSAGRSVESSRFRIVSSRNMASAAAWPSRWEATQSGVYRIVLHANVFESDSMFYAPRSEPARVGLYARPKIDNYYAPFGELRKLAEFEVLPGREQPQRLVAEVELFAGDLFGVRWENGPAYSDPPRRDYSQAFLADRLVRDRLYYAAMQQYGGGPRGTTQVQVYEATKALMESGTLDLQDPRLDKLPEDFGGGLGDRPHNWIKAFVHEELERFGPAIDLSGFEVVGPLRLIEDEQTRARRARSERFLGPERPGLTDRERIGAVLKRFLPRAFRRPASEEQIRIYADIAERHVATTAGARLEDGLHLAVRRALVSPLFLYRGVRADEFDEYDLASRLSFFLTSCPPDEELYRLAMQGKLSDPQVLAQQVDRLLADQRNGNFVRSFTGQWLSTRLLEGIMPDPRLLRFYDPDRRALVDETEMFFAEILRENLPLETFIDPDFSYRNARLNKIYGGDLEGNEMRRVTFERGGRHGGILGLGAVMMATANGVDTQPVLRGVWLLENVVGAPPPPPPGNVPAIATDTSGATSIRDQLAAHRADPSCASCHNEIDPLGMVLENFDPVGRWRDHYPRYTKPPDGQAALTEEFYSTVGKGVLRGPAVDAVGVLTDGTRLEDVTDLKRYLLARLDVFASCLTEKLMVYATGRPLSFGDRLAAERIAKSAVERGDGFRDLIVAVVQSEPFSVR